MRTPFAFILLAGVGFSLPAQAPTQPAASTPTWDVTQARGKTREIDFTTDEGTWMSVDISSDGAWITFDLLGHIYRVSSSGGEATALTQNSGVALNFHPRISPDGRLIAFISDRRGQNNLWVMNADGSNPRAVFTDPAARAAEPAWSADGSYIVVRRSGVGGGGGGGGGGAGLWMYHKDGGTGVPLVTESRPESPSLSRDGKYLYYQVAITEGIVSGKNDVTQGSRQLRRLELATGRVLMVTEGLSEQQYQGSSGGAVAPQVSPDGRWLAFGRRIPNGTVEFKGLQFGPRTALWLRDLESGTERVVMDPIEVDMAEGGKVSRVLPGYAWTADGKAIVIAQGGKIRRLDVASGRVDEIPFTARVRRTISEQAMAPRSVRDDTLDVQYLRWASRSPDGKRATFEGAGKLWITDVPNGTPRRLTPASFAAVELSPAWSPDGQWIAFATFDDEKLGALWKVRAAGGEPIRLTKVAGEYLHPAWAPDGRELIVTRGNGGFLRQHSMSNNTWYELRRVAADGSFERLVTEVKRPFSASRPGMPRRPIVQASYGPGGRIYFPETHGAVAARPGVPAEVVETDFVSVNRDGGDRKVHLTFPFVDEAVISPDGRWLLYQEGDNAYLAPFPATGTGEAPPRIEHGRNSRLPVRQLSLEGGLFPHWRDSVTAQFASGNRIITVDTRTNKADTITIALKVPKRVPSGTVALTNARIITMENRNVIASGTVVVRGGRIACIGTCDTGSAQVIDASGKTIMPGLIDLHAHHHRDHEGVLPRKNWESAVYMAYGVTTTLDNSMWSGNVFPTAQMIEAGMMIGPRTYSSGDPLYAGDAQRQNDLASLAVTEQNVKRLQSWGAVTMKQYSQPRRDQRQWVSAAARRFGLRVTAEGGDIEFNMSMIMDGQTGWEHPWGVVPIYGDVAKFFGKAQAFYSPTFAVGGASAWNEDYWYAESDVFKDPKLQSWLPWQMLIPQTRRRMLRPATDYSFPLIARGLADIIAEGGYGAIGSHGQQHGLGSHWEVWMAASAMGPMGALEVGTIHGARFIGIEKDAGSLAVGKLADLLVLDGNPLDDIRQTRNIRYVMKSGIMYDGMTLDEVWPAKTPFGVHWWVNPDVLKADAKRITPGDGRP
jgi:Tol biopolymer transport system component/imidazolonepropionase-like amidohydrolase